MTKAEHEKYFVSQYALLEKEFIDTMQYVSFEEDNYKTYSNKYAKLLLQIGSEIDNLMRNICGLTGRTSITDYADGLFMIYPSLDRQKLIVKGNKLELLPFDNWDKYNASQSLVFWDAYNKVKHDRIQNNKLANLENVSLGLGGLYILNEYYSHDLYEKDKEEFSDELGYESSIFVLDNWIKHLRPSKVKLEVPYMDDECGQLI